MFFETYIPSIPTTLPEIFIYVGAFLGIIFLVYSVFIEQEHRQDIIRLLGTGGLLVYGIYIQDAIIIIAMAAVGLASLVEFIEILFGLHTHGPEDLKKYKQLWRIGRKTKELH